MSFQGFADESASFFKRLSKNQTRDWFQAHKAEFEEGYDAPMKELLAEVAAKIDASFPRLDLDAPRVFRIYRDVRFSKDKSPYKTHVGGFIPIKRKGGGHEVPIALYFHVGLPKTFAAAGHHMMDAHALEGFRRAVVDDKRGKELDRMLAALQKKGFSVDSHETYKRVPKGFDANHPRAAHLVRKGLTVGFPEMPKGTLASPKLVAYLVSHIKLAAPLVEWLAFATA